MSPEWLEKLAQFADGELCETEHRDLEVALADRPNDRAVVQGWQNLRASAERGFGAVETPTALREVLVHQMRAREQVARPRIIRTAAISAFAAAAVFMFAVNAFDRDFWAAQRGIIRPAYYPRISTGTFAKLHGESGSSDIDAYRIAGKTSAVATRNLARIRDALPLAGMKLPNFGSLRAGRSCQVAPNVAGLQVVYATDDGALVTLIVTQKMIKLMDAEQPVVSASERDYETVSTDALTLVKWDDDRGCSLTLCAQMPTSDLLTLAETIKLASLPDRPGVWSTTLASIAP